MTQVGNQADTATIRYFLDKLTMEPFQHVFSLASMGFDVFQSIIHLEVGRRKRDIILGDQNSDIGSLFKNWDWQCIQDDWIVDGQISSQKLREQIQNQHPEIFAGESQGLEIGGIFKNLESLRINVLVCGLAGESHLRHESKKIIQAFLRQIVDLLFLHFQFSQQQETEAILRETEAKYHSIFDNVVEGIYQSSPDGNYLDVNKTLVEIYGYDSPDDLIHAINDIEKQLYVDPVRRLEFVKLMAEQDTITGFESQIFRKDMTKIWITESARRVTDENGNLKYYEGTVQNITSEREARQALENSETLYHSLVESLPQNIFRKNREGIFTFANENFARALGESIENIIGNTDFDFFPEDLAEKYQKDDKAILDTLIAFETIEEYRDSSGERKFVQVVKNPLYDAQGNVIGIQGIFWDVTEKKKMEETLQFERDLHQALLDSSPDLIFFKDTGCRYLKVSKAMLDYLKLESHDQVLGKTDYDFFSHEKARELMAQEDAIISSGKPILNKLQETIHEDGKSSWGMVTKFPIYSTQGHITGIVGLVNDVTPLKEAEYELQRARDGALELARVKSEFLANVSHEIRTPMNAIIGNCELLRETHQNPEQKELVQTIGQSAETLHSMVDDILDFSKMEAGKLKIEKLPIDLRRLVGETAEIFGEKGHSKGLELIVDCQKDVPQILEGDPLRIQQILINLINNAIKFTDNGEIVVSLKILERDNKNITLKLSVEDTGIGIESNALSQLFQAFTQADGSMARRYGGTGLGLAIIKNLAELMGGSVGVESQAGQGSKFWVVLPSMVIEERGSLISSHEPVVKRIALWGKNQRWVETTRMILLNYGLGVTVIEAEKTLPHEQFDKDTHLFLGVPAGPEEWEAMDHIQKFLSTWPAEKVVLITPVKSELVVSEWTPSETQKLYKPLQENRLEQLLFPDLSGDDQSLDDVKSSRQEDPLSEPDALKRFSIMVVEDNPFNSGLARRQLMRYGAENLVFAANGLEAVEEFEKKEFDLIFMDCQMPEMDGYAATQKIREIETSHSKTDSIPIIAMTANTMDEDKRKCVEAGMTDYLAKPVRLPNLESVLKKYLFAKKEVANQTTKSPPSAEGQDDQKSSLLTFPVIESDLVPEKYEPNSEDHEMIERLVKLFVKDTNDRLKSLDQALETQDTQSALKVAHTLKGSSSNLGAPRLNHLCKRLETELKENGLEELNIQKVEAIKLSFKDVYDELTRRGFVQEL